MEKEVKWDVSYYTEGGKFQITINDERVGRPIHTRMTADRMRVWLEEAGHDIATVFSRELGGV